MADWNWVTIQFPGNIFILGDREREREKGKYWSLFLGKFLRDNRSKWKREWKSRGKFHFTVGAFMLSYRISQSIITSPVSAN